MGVEFDPKVNCTWYGDPSESIEDLGRPDDYTWRRREDQSRPIIGDELCDGHQMHYLWQGDRWR